MVMNCRDKDLQRKLLSDYPDDAGVDVILAAMRAEESATSDCRFLQSSTKPSATAGAAGGHANQRRKDPLNHSRPCSACGEKGHSYLSPKCKLAQHICEHCSKKGHAIDRCFAKKREESEEEQQQPSRDRKIGKRGGAAFKQICANVYDDDNKSAITASLFLLPPTGKGETKTAKFIADSGATITTMTTLRLAFCFMHKTVAVPLSSLVRAVARKGGAATLS